MNYFKPEILVLLRGGLVLCHYYDAELSFYLYMCLTDLSIIYDMYIYIYILTSLLLMKIKLGY